MRKGGARLLSDILKEMDALSKIIFRELKKEPLTYNMLHSSIPAKDWIDCGVDWPNETHSTLSSILILLLEDGNIEYVDGRMYPIKRPDFT